MPPIPEPHVSSESLYGTCLEIYNKTDDSYSIVDEYPDPRTLDWNKWQGWTDNDDFVMSDPNIPDIDRTPNKANNDLVSVVVLACSGITALWILHRLWQSYKNRGRVGYTELKT